MKLIGANHMRQHKPKAAEVLEVRYKPARGVETQGQARPQDGSVGGLRLDKHSNAVKERIKLVCGTALQIRKEIRREPKPRACDYIWHFARRLQKAWPRDFAKVGCFMR